MVRKIKREMERTAKRRAVAYIRVSSEGQVQNGFGLESQEDKVRKYAEKNNIELVAIFREEATKGTKDVEDRVALVEAIDCMEDEHIDLCIISELSRLARGILIQEKILDDFEKKGWEMISVKEPDLCSDDPERKLMRTIIGGFNEYDRSMIVGRLKAGRATKARQGQNPVGRIPMGFESVTVDGRKVLKRIHDEVELVKVAFELREQGLGYKKIADYLNENGYKPKNWTEAKPTAFYSSTLHKMLNNPKYQGIVELHDNGKVIAAGTSDTLRII